jgi:hypothetical protein
MFEVWVCDVTYSIEEIFNAAGTPDFIIAFLVLSIVFSLLQANASAA